MFLKIPPETKNGIGTQSRMPLKYPYYYIIRHYVLLLGIGISSSTKSTAPNNVGISVAFHIFVPGVGVWCVIYLVTRPCIHQAETRVYAKNGKKWGEKLGFLTFFSSLTFFSPNFLLPLPFAFHCRAVPCL